MDRKKKKRKTRVTNLLDDCQMQKLLFDYYNLKTLQKVLVNKTKHTSQKPEHGRSLSCRSQLKTSTSEAKTQSGANPCNTANPKKRSFEQNKKQQENAEFC